MEKVGWTKKHWAFVILVALAALYIFEITNSIISPIVNFNLESAPFIKVRNLIGFSFFILAVLIYLNQIDYRNINIIGWNFTYWVFLLVVVISGLWLFEPSSSIVNFIMEYKLNYFPIISIRNGIGIILFILAYKIYKVIKP